MLGLKQLSVRDVLLSQAVNTAGSLLSGFISRQWLTDSVYYDTLITGASRAGMYGTCAHLIEELTSMFVSAVPTIVLAQMGFVNNGGCQCGCGAPCPANHRWICPHDIGYACKTALLPSNPPFFGDPHRKAPCTWQPDSVLAVIRTSSIFLNPAVNMPLALSVFCYPVSDSNRKLITEETIRREQNLPFFDPVFLLPINSDNKSTLDELSAEEMAMLRQRGGKRRLTWRLSAGFTFVLVAEAVCVQRIFTSWGDKALVLFMVTISTWCTVFSVLIFLKLRALSVNAEVLQSKANTARFYKVNMPSRVNGRNPQAQAAVRLLAMIRQKKHCIPTPAT